MASWAEIAAAHPEFAGRARELFDVHKHKTLASLRRDGSPRISGTEVSFVGDDLWFGSMLRSRKALDLLRDPRFALHGPTVDPGDDWKGDVKISGRATEVDDASVKATINEGIEGGDPGEYHLFRADIAEMVVTAVEAGYLKIEVWREGRGLADFKRK